MELEVDVSNNLAYWFEVWTKFLRFMIFKNVNFLVEFVIGYKTGIYWRDWDIG